ncbi:Ppx/GppA phosphatase family protein [Undibacterium sp. 5I1]|uniref:Ppx/GppA phosphatase family protein n=1 Tax=unclassified Undibacterium TaxID=2630295 RepID=UPI002AB4562C|nr:MULTISPECIES: Ppx/GppA phosphatase family protein [unclassified Undibacterium]MDY7538913.1 Ppx/GppA phosphatase family protein [Undibacterium sp. 5I1]MEB0232708.1 Ppx/GppA phosphatase family protein [Undibacterium sp. 10I3]MEB0257780.1 Ppx/GppA phosphatase family protein [Undibacterium sp. 5I1]
MFAAVDLGSNSFRLHIGRHEGDVIRVVKSARDPIRLAAGLDQQGNLSPAAIQSAIACLARFKQILDSYPLDAVRVVATNTIRIAKNSADFMPAAEAAIGYPIDIISGEEEGRLIYMGVSNSIAIPGERRLALDIGGGSTEVILGRGHEVVKVESFSIGTVKHSSTFFPQGRITEAGFEAAVLSARSMFEDAAPPYQPEHWRNAYGSSGTIRAISDAIAKNNLGDGSITLKSLITLKQYCVQCGQVSQLELTGIKPERVAMVVGGLAILIALLQEFSITVLQPIEAGLRMGVMWDLYLRATKRDRREQAVHNVATMFYVDATRASRVADMVRSLYAQLKPATDTYIRHLHWSAMLHEVGMAISHTGYHKHGAYMIENADMAGFTTREQRVMSKLILSQKGNLRKISDSFADLDFAKAVLALRLSVTFMHSRIELDYADFSLKMKSKIELEIRQDWVTLHPTVAFWLQKEIEFWREVGVEFIVKANI